MSSMVWKDTLLPGASRVALPWTLNGAVLPGYAGDSNPDPQAGYQQRNDWVAGPGGVPMISGSSGAPPGTPSPGFQPVDPGQYGTNPYFAGRPVYATAPPPVATNNVLGTPAATPAAAANPNLIAPDIFAGLANINPQTLLDSLIQPSVASQVNLGAAPRQTSVYSQLRGALLKRLLGAQ